MTEHTCRLCGAPLTRTFVDLGNTPLANAYVTVDEVAHGADRAYPLHAWVCDSCLLVQVDAVVPATAIFSDYAVLLLGLVELGCTCRPVCNSDD